MATIILVRHAATAWTGSRYSGRSDPPLDDAGAAAARRLADDLAPTLAPATRVVTSPLRRATATAAAIATAAGIDDITIDDRWCEADFGSAEGLTFEEIELLAPDLARRLADGESGIDWPDGERADDLVSRVTEAWRDLATVRGDAIIVSHAGPLRIALGLATGQPANAVDLPGPGAVIRLPTLARR